MGCIKSFTKKILLKIIVCYQWGISPLLGKNCRFYPTCSQYAFEAIEKHGTILGFGLTLKRVLKCHPWCQGGIDEVP